MQICEQDPCWPMDLALEQISLHALVAQPEVLADDCCVLCLSGAIGDSRPGSQDDEAKAGRKQPWHSRRPSDTCTVSPWQVTPLSQMLAHCCLPSLA